MALAAYNAGPGKKGLCISAEIETYAIIATPDGVRHVKRGFASRLRLKPNYSTSVVLERRSVKRGFASRLRLKPIMSLELTGLGVP